MGNKERVVLRHGVCLQNKQKKRIQMKRAAESWKNDLIQRVSELAKNAQELSRIALPQYAVEVEAILKAQSRDSRRIENCLDAMLDFCFDDEMLVLYKKLCRYYYDIDPETTAFYVYAYREMWDESPDSRLRIKN